MLVLLDIIILECPLSYLVLLSNSVCLLLPGMHFALVLAVGLVLSVVGPPVLLACLIFVVCALLLSVLVFLVPFVFAFARAPA